MMDPEIANGTDHYIDDVIVNEDVVSVDKVIKHLAKWGLESKQAQPLESSKVLGLQLQREVDGELTWHRGKPLPEAVMGSERKITRRELFSICGQLIGHYPVVGWIRVGCGFIKRQSSGTTWDDDIGERAKVLLHDLVARVMTEDPVRGRWSPPVDGSVRIWCDASSVAIGTAVEINGSIMEDAAWLRKVDDAAHINVAELEAVIRGLNLAIKWKATDVELITDSATVKGWLESVFSSTHKARVHGIAEMLVKRRLGILSELVEEFGLRPVVTLVPSSQNKADVLTRVPSTWLKRQDRDRAVVSAVTLEQLRSSHSLHHFGVERSLGVARQQFGEVSRSKMEKVVKACSRCRCVDPAPVRWKHGTLAVEENWSRLAIDTTHYGGRVYLTMVDCGPGRFAIWRLIASDSSDCICREFEQVCLERGPPREILLDNSTSFRSSKFEELCEKWQVERHFRCAFRPETNGIVERNHRTVKRMAARTGESPLRMVYWYNVAERVPGEELTAPYRNVHTYKWRTLLSQKVSDDVGSLGRLFKCVSVGSDSESEVEDETRDGFVEKQEAGVRGKYEYKEGDRVVVRPPAARCTTEWTPAEVTEVKSETNIEVDGIPRHVSDLRPAPDWSEEEARADPASSDAQGGSSRRLSGQAVEKTEDYRARLRPRPVNPPSYDFFV